MRSTWARSPRARPGGRRRRRRPGRRRPAAVRRPIPARGRADRADARPGGATAGCSTRPRWPARNVVLPRSGRGSASAGPAPDLAVVGGAEHRALAAELAARSITLVRDPAGLLPVRWRRRTARSRGHAPTDRPHPGRHLVDGRAGSRRPRCAATMPTWTRWSVETEPDAAAIAAVRDRGAGGGSRGRRHHRRAPRSVRRSRSSRPSPRPARRRSRSRCAGRGTWRPTRPA